MEDSPFSRPGRKHPDGRSRKVLGNGPPTKDERTVSNGGAPHGVQPAAGDRVRVSLRVSLARWTLPLRLATLALVLFLAGAAAAFALARHAEAKSTVVVHVTMRHYHFTLSRQHFAVGP